MNAILQSAINNGTLPVSKARKITAVLTLENQNEWIEKAQALPTRRLEQEVARVLPQEAVSERLKFVSAERLELRVGISKELQALVEVYLEVKDPVKRAERIMNRKSGTPKNDADSCVTGHVDGANREPIPASVRHQVQFRDGGKCAHVNARGERCENRRWLDVHHIQPRSMGGDNRLENLQLLCSAHHRSEHARETG